MKVLRVTSSMNPDEGGVVEAINQACKLFNDNKYRMDVLCHDESNVKKHEDSKDYCIISLGKGVTSYKFNIKLIHWLINNSRKYDLVIIDGLWQFHSISGFILKLLGVPYFVFVHGMLDPYFNSNKLKYFKKLPFWFLIERNILAMANGVIFTCEEEKRLAAKSFPFYKVKPLICSLGVEGCINQPEVTSEAFLDTYPDLRDKSFMLFLSRVNPKKGLDLLIKSFARLSDTHGKVIAIAGPSNAAYKEELMSLIRNEGIENSVFWLGSIRGDVKWGAYELADCFILPSHQENFGIVVAEALSTSTPTLISNKVNIYDEVERFSAGFVSEDTVDGTFDSLNRWLSLTPEEKSNMGKQAYLCYSSCFSTASAYSQLKKCLDLIA